MTKTIKDKLDAAAEKYERAENRTGYYERIKEDHIAGATFMHDLIMAEAEEILLKAVAYYDGAHNEHWAIDLNEIGDPARNALERWFAFKGEVK